ncbi:hypothetical protein D3C78_614500 [compost metagenome]
MVPVGLLALTLSASCAGVAETRSNWPSTGVLSRRPLAASRIARPPVGPWLPVLPGISTETSENCRRSMLVRRSVPSRPTMLSVTVMMSSLVSSKVPLSSISMV